MTNTNTFIANRLREVYLNGRWIANTNYQELIADLTWKQATHQVANLNTIAALVYHVNYYLVGLLKVLNGGDLTIRDKYSFDLPPIQSEEDWTNLVKEFLANAAAFADKVDALPDSQFDAPFVKEKYGTYWRNLEGVIEHSYYHMGQIAILKKMILGLD